MLHTQEETFLRHLKNDPLSRVYILCGQEEYLKTLYAGRIVKKALAGGSEDFNFHPFDGKSLKCDALADAVEAMPMLGGKSCVQVRDMDFDKLPGAEYQKLKEILTDPPEYSVLLFVCSGEFSLKKSSRFRALQKQMDAFSQIVELQKRGEGELYRFAVDRASQYDASISRDTFRTLHQLCAGDMLNLKNEMDKLAAFCRGREITEADLSLCCCPVIETSAFELSRAVIRGDYDGAMETLQELLYLREEPVAIVGALAAGFIDIYRAKLASRQGKGQNEILAAFDYKGREFRVRNAMREVSRCSTAFLRGALELLTETDLQLKSSGISDQVLLEKLLTQLFVLRQSEQGKVD